MPRLTEEEWASLSELALSGDRGAMDRLVVEAHRFAMWYATQSIRAYGTAIDPHDLAAEAVVRILKYLPRYDPSKATLKAYFLMIAKSSVRTIASRHRHLPSIEDLAEPPATPRSDTVEVADEVALVRRMLDHLRPVSREILERYYGLDGREPEGQTAIGKSLRISQQAVENRLRRAEQAIADRIRRERSP